jgi:hypothetical protein
VVIVGLILFVGVWAGALGHASAFPRADELSGGEGQPLIWGLPFDVIEARVEGRRSDSVLTAKGRLLGTDLVVQYEQRFNSGEDGTESVVSLAMPVGDVRDLASLLGHFPSLAGFDGGGQIGFWATATGRGEDRRWKGRVEIKDVFLKHEKSELRLAGLSGVLDWTVLGGEFKTAPRQLLVIDCWKWGEVAGQRAWLEFEMVSGGEWRIGPLTMDIASGQIRVGRVSLNPADPNFRAGLTADGISLAEGFQMAPELEIEGEGLIDGQVGVRVRHGKVEIESGFLGLRPEVSARLRFSPRPRLTGGMSPQNPKFRNLQTIERALEDFELNDLWVEILPNLPPEAAFKVGVEGRPLLDGIEAPVVKLTLQVHGPVAQFGSWLLQPKIRMEKAANRSGAMAGF